MISFQQPTLILFGLGKYIHLRVVEFHWPKIVWRWYLCHIFKCIFITKLWVNLCQCFDYELVKILPNHLPNIYQIFSKCYEIQTSNIIQFTILATLPESSTLGKTRLNLKSEETWTRHRGYPCVLTSNDSCHFHKCYSCKKASLIIHTISKNRLCICKCSVGSDLGLWPQWG